MFKVNEGSVDRIIRIILGAGLIVIGFFLKDLLAIISWVLGGILVLTGITGFCGLYVLLGINTCPLNKK